MTLNSLPRRRSLGFLPHYSLLVMAQAGPVFLFVGDGTFGVCSIEHRVEATFAFYEMTLTC